jgi:hypothetical protein
MKRFPLLLVTPVLFSLSLFAAEIPPLLIDSNKAVDETAVKKNEPTDTAGTCFPYEVLDFEEVGNLLPIGTILNATFPDPWLGLVDSDAGGNGNFANEPSPETVAYVPDPDDPVTPDIVVGEIIFEEPVGGIAFYYVSVSNEVSDEPLTLYLYDADDQLVGSFPMPDTPLWAEGDPTGPFASWHYEVHHLTENIIARAEFVGAGSYFAIDDLSYLIIGTVIDDDEDEDSDI